MDLRANAIITAIDRFSGPVGRMAGALNGLTGRANRMMGAAGRMTQGVERAGRAVNRMGSGFGVPSTMLSALALKGEYDVDRLSRQMQAVGELSAAQRKMLVGNAFKTGEEVGVAVDELITAQSELIKGGISDPETVAASSLLVAKAAKTNAMQFSQVAEDAINVARGLGFAFDSTEERTVSLARALDFMSVIPALSTESWEGLRESLKYSAPVAKMLNIEIEQLGAALSILADRGFKGEQGGTAFRTILLRGIAPTKQLAQAYRAAGIELTDLYKLDESLMNDKGRLRERVLAAGIGGDADELDRALAGVGDVTKYDGLYAYQDKLMASLSETLGIGPGDAQDKGILKKVIDQHIFSAIGDFDIEKFFGAISKLPLSDFAKVAGIQRTSQARALLEDLQRLEPLTEQFRRLIPEATERRFEPVDEGFSQSIDKVTASLRTLRHEVFEAGLGKDLEGLFSGLSGAVKQMAQTDPATLNLVAKGGLLTALAAGIAALASSPLAKAVMAVTALATAAGSVDPEKGAVREFKEWMGKQDSQSWLDWAGTAAGDAHIGLYEWLHGRSDARKMMEIDYPWRLRADPPYDPNPRDGEYGPPVPPNLVRDVAPTAGPSSIDVTGKVDANVHGTVEGKVTGTVDVQVRVEGPGQVISKTGGALSGSASGTLNTGKSMPDTAGP